MASLDGMPVVFFVVRHGKTLFNEMGKVQGWCDTPLTEDGVEVARALGRGLARIPFADAYSSDMGRAIQTLREVLAARSEANPSAAQPRRHDPDERLREWCYGDLEGGTGAHLHDVLEQAFGERLPQARLNERLPDIANAIARWDESGRAERFDQVKARLCSFFHEAGDRAIEQGGGNVLIVTHSFAIRSIMYLLDASRVNDPLMIENASVTQVGYDGKAFVLGETGSTKWLA